MSAIIIDGKQVAAGIREQLKHEVAEFVAETGIQPGLATVLVGGDPASEVYVANKRRSATAAGLADLHVHLDGAASSDEIAQTIREHGENPAVSGILLQLPLPGGMDSGPLIDLIEPFKDVDGLTTTSAGLLARGKPGLRPCTPSGVVALLDSAEVPLEGAEVTIIGRSELVGAPLAQLLIQRNATVTVAHSRTRDLASVTRRSDIVIAAAGVPRLIGEAHVRPGAAVIDVGIHRTPQGLVGDVDFESVSRVAGWITPVPGGVGPMTIAMLLRNTLLAARLQHG